MSQAGGKRADQALARWPPPTQASTATVGACVGMTPTQCHHTDGYEGLHPHDWPPVDEISFQHRHFTPRIRDAVARQVQHRDLVPSIGDRSRNWPDANRACISLPTSANLPAGTMSAHSQDILPKFISAVGRPRKPSGCRTASARLANCVYTDKIRPVPKEEAVMVPQSYCLTGSRRYRRPTSLHGAGKHRTAERGVPSLPTEGLGTLPAFK